MAVSAAAPAMAASPSQDISVAATGCTDPLVGNNTLNFAVTAIGADLPAGSVLRFTYSGGNSYPTWSGTLATMSNTTENRQGTASFSRAYGTVSFTLRQAITRGTTATVAFSYDIGLAAQSATATFAIVSGLTAANNYSTDNDSAHYNIGQGSCNR